MNALLASAVLLIALTGLVVFTMAVENWARIVQPLAAPLSGDDADLSGDDADLSGDDADLSGDDAEEAVETVETVDADGTDGSGEERSDAPTVAATAADGPAPVRIRLFGPAPAAGDPDGALRITPTALVVRDQDTADVVAGLLFAGYAVSRRTGADRAAAWVTAAATPPSLDADRFPPDVDLRGRPARVAELLAADDAGVTWLTLRRSVDIARGTTRSPVRQPTLAGLLVWWEVTRSLPSVIAADDVARLADAVEQIRTHLDDSPWATVAADLSAALIAARDRRSALLVAPAVDTASEQDVDDRPTVAGVTDARTTGEHASDDAAPYPAGRRSDRSG